MDDALVHRRVDKIMNFYHNSLNPCCNGWCTRTNSEGKYPVKQIVLILVVMDDALVLGRIGGEYIQDFIKS